MQYMIVQYMISCATHDCALGISPFTSYSGVKEEVDMTSVLIGCQCKVKIMAEDDDVLKTTRSGDRRTANVCSSWA